MKAVRLILATSILAIPCTVRATTKAGTGTDLTDPASWGGTAPGATDTAQWISTSLGTGLTIASPVTWGALDFEGSAAAVGITGAGTLTLNGGQTINTIANSGLVVASTANGTTTLGVANLELGANQTWTTDGAKGVTFSLTNTTNLKGFTLDLNITGTASAQGSLNNFNFNSTSVKNGTINANAGTNVNFSQSGIGNYSLGTDLKININPGSFVRINGSTAANQVTDYSAEVHLKGGTLLFSGGNVLPTLASTGKLIVDSNSTISTQTSASSSPTNTIAAPISGSGNLNIAPTAGRPAQNVILTNANSGYSGAWTLTAPGATGPTLTVADGGGLGDGSPTNTVNLGTATTLAFTNTTGTLSIANAISGSGKLTKSGAGTATMSGNNSYTDTTTVSAGSLLINGTHSGNGAVSVTAGTLGGVGNLASTVTVGNSAGTADSLITGGSLLTVGTLTSSGALSLNSDAAFSLQLDSTGGVGSFDKLVFAGITLNASSTLSILDIASSAAALPIDAAFTIIDNTSGSLISGTFAGLSEGSVVGSGLNQFKVSYVGGTGNDMTLTVVPEPSALTAVLGGLGMLVGVGRRRRQA